MRYVMRLWWDTTRNPIAHRLCDPPAAKTRASRLLLLSLLLGLLLLLFLLLALRLHYCSRDTVEVPLAVLGDPATAVVGLLEDADLLERLADLALDGRGRVGVVRGAVAAAVAAAV